LTGRPGVAGRRRHSWAQAEERGGEMSCVVEMVCCGDVGWW